MSIEANLVRWGRVAYPDAHERQRKLVQARIAGEIADTLILCEHDAVVTAGRGFRETLPENLPFPVVEVERGGLLTYHGPGQLVGYPIFSLRERERDIHRYLENVEGALIDALTSLGVSATNRGGLRGVWIGDKKVASIGVAVRRWVTYHGFALNVTADPKLFSSFNPCGLAPDVMTSLHEAGADIVDWVRVEEEVVAAFSDRFDRRFVERPSVLRETHDNKGR